MNVPILSDKIIVTSKYGSRQYTYQNKKVNDFHCGIDLVPSPCNRNEILAYEDGLVTGIRKTGEQYGLGCYVRIKHENGFYTYYNHMTSGSICVNIGDKVKKGQKIGIIGTTGQSTGVHLHFQIDKGDSKTSVDPYDYLFNNIKLVDNVYKLGLYIVNTPLGLNVRKGPSTNYSIIKTYKNGTRFDTYEIKNNWARTPSGWVCLDYCNLIRSY